MSLSVQSDTRASRLIRSSLYCWVAKRRCPPGRSRRAPRLARDRAPAARDRRPPRARGRARRARGRPPRPPLRGPPTGAPDDPPAGEPRLPPAPAGFPRRRSRTRTSHLLGIAGQRAHYQPHPAHPVDERVVHLAVDREAVTFQALDQVDLPQRPVEVELVAVQARDQDAQLALTPGMRQRRVADVIVEIDVVRSPASSADGRRSSAPPRASGSTAAGSPAPRASARTLAAGSPRGRPPGA